MAQKRTETATTEDIEAQISTIRSDISTLTGLLKELASQKVEDVRKTARNDEVEALTQALLGKSGAATGSSTPVGTVTGAAVIGLIIGRSLHR